MQPKLISAIYGVMLNQCHLGSSGTLESNLEKIQHQPRTISKWRFAMRKFALSALFAMFSGLAMAEVQFVCTYGSEVLVTNQNSERPETRVVPKKTKYAFYVDMENLKANYVNLSHGSKMPLVLTVHPQMMVLTEDIGADNHFTVTIFTNRRKDELYPSVRSFHSFGLPVEYYGPSISLGYCSAV